MRGLRVAERLAAGSKRGSEDECWPWIKSRIGDGYGKMSSVTIAGEYRLDEYAHRVAWAFENGRWPAPGKAIMHSCDNSWCVNPNHLSEGTYGQNAVDRPRTGKWFGIGRGNGKVTLEQALEIRNSSERQIVLAERYGVSQPTISRIRTGKVYSDARWWPGLDTV